MKAKDPQSIGDVIDDMEIVIHRLRGWGLVLMAMGTSKAQIEAQAVEMLGDTVTDLGGDLLDKWRELHRLSR